MPLIEVTLAEGRSPEKLRGLISKLTDAFVETDVAKKEAVQVVLAGGTKDALGRRR